MTQYVEFYVTDLDGLVLRSGVCLDSQVGIQQKNNERAFVGSRPRPLMDIADSSGNVLSPSFDLPHTQVSPIRIEGLPNPTEVTWPGQPSPIRLQQGFWENYQPIAVTYLLESPGYLPLEVTLEPGSVPIDVGGGF